jgi:hypothetical protein
MSPETDAVSFPAWKSAVAKTGWPQDQQAEYRREILSLLHLGKVWGAPATIIVVKEYLAERARQGPNSARVPWLCFFRRRSRPVAGCGAEMVDRGKRVEVNALHRGGGE